MEETTIATIATEALKPVSGILNALLSAKVERIKIWAEEREYQNRLADYKINIILEQYLKRLLRRISEIQTIVVPHQQFPLPSLYEPLSLRGKFDLSENETNKEFNAQTLDSGQNYLIIDSAGMGKSTFVKHLVLDIINSTIKIPIFLELRRIEENKTLLQTIAKEIDESQTGIDEKLLLMLLDQGGFVIVLDGYDELSEQLRKKINKQITELTISCDKNSLILTARPEVILPEIPNSKAFTINRLGREQAEAIAIRYDNIVKLDVGKQLITQFDKVNENFLQTPLFIALLYKTYWFNQSIATKITSFYEDVFNAFYKGHDLTKSSGFERDKASNLDSEDFRRLLRGFSFLLVARQKSSFKNQAECIATIEEAIKLTSIQPISANNFFDDLLYAVPLLIREGTEFRFIHKSISEFFAAEFLAFTPKTEKLIQKILNGKSFISFVNTLELLSEVSPNLFKRLIVAPLAKQVLLEKNSAKNPYVRSMSFLNEMKLGLWTYKKYIQKGENGHDLPNFPEEPGFQMGSYNYVKIKNQKYILAIHKMRSTKRMLPAAWRLITADTEISVDEVLKNSVKGYKNLEKIIPKDKWIDLKSKKIKKITNNSDFQRTIIMALIIMNQFLYRDYYYIRVIDNNVCKNLLEEIKQENNSKRLLSQLISGK